MHEYKLPAGLYIVATPIGTARDITLRALDILGSADVLAAEDTRTTRKLLNLHGIPLAGRKLVSYHDHSAADARARLLDHVRQGQAVAVVSDAGTPLVADPGYALVVDAIEAGIPIATSPGPSALLAALTVAGQPTDRFYFGGFLPAKASGRLSALEDAGRISATLVFFESPHRIEATMAAINTAYGPDRQISLCRELTKKFEQVIRGPVSEVASALGDTMPAKGEFVIVVGPPAAQEATEADLDQALNLALETQSVRDAATDVSEALGLPRKVVYKRALELSK